MNGLYHKRLQDVTRSSAQKIAPCIEYFATVYIVIDHFLWLDNSVTSL